MNLINIYCDESCHLEHDNSDFMVLGAVWCPLKKVKEINKRIKEIKLKHGLSPFLEIKWSKVSLAREDFYQDLVDYFFDDDDLHFRALVASKRNLDHKRYHQSHDSWYYKMYFYTLSPILHPESSFNVYIDIKDTCSQSKVIALKEVLSNSKFDFDRDIINRIQQVRSHEVTLVQMSDLLSGAVCYLNRQLKSSKAKLALVNRIRERSGYSLQKSTLLREDKFNLFFWQPREEENV